MLTSFQRMTIAPPPPPRLRLMMMAGEGAAGAAATLQSQRSVMMSGPYGIYLSDKNFTLILI
jgi:hypothetical protein